MRSVTDHRESSTVENNTIGTINFLMLKLLCCFKVIKLNLSLFRIKLITFQGIGRVTGMYKPRNKTKALRLCYHIELFYIGVNHR
jgi:hypothetical protein